MGLVKPPSSPRGTKNAEFPVRSSKRECFFILRNRDVHLWYTIVVAGILMSRETIPARSLGVVMSNMKRLLFAILSVFFYCAFVIPDAEFGALLEAAKKGNADARLKVGVMYFEGEGVSKNKEEAARWLRLAAGQGNAEAQSKLGWMYMYGEGVQKNEAEAFRWTRSAAEQGNAKAQCNLSLLYEDGLGVPVDESQAMIWLKKSAEQGYVWAQYNLGLSDTSLFGTDLTQAESEKWLRLAADQLIRLAAEESDPKAMFYLGKLYSMGRGVARDPAKAKSLWIRAAEHGWVEAQFHVGAMYDNGVIIEKNTKEAYFWFSLAASGGDEVAKLSVGRLAESLTAADLKALQQRVREWKPKTKTDR